MPGEINEILKGLWLKEALNAQQLEEPLVEKKGGRPSQWRNVKQSISVDDKWTVWIVIGIALSSEGCLRDDVKGKPS